MGLFERLIRNLYFAWFKDEDINDLSHQLMSLRDKYADLTIQIRERSLDLLTAHRELDKYKNHKPMPWHADPAIVESMLQYISDKEKARQPIDCLTLYGKIITAYKSDTTS